MHRKISPQIAGAQRAYIKEHCHSIKNMITRKFAPALPPCPALYYQQQFPHLKPRSGWVSVLCCFHEDTHPSLRLHLTDGHFKCFSCGAKGGSIAAFHALKYKMDFYAAVKKLEAWRYER